MRGEVPTRWSKNRRGWHLDKTISISHIVTFLGIAVALIIRLDDIEDSTQHNRQAIEQLNKDFDRLDEKMDRLLSRQTKRDTMAP